MWCLCNFIALCIIFCTEVHSLLGVKGDNKSKKKGAGRPKGSKSKDKDVTFRSKPHQDERSSYPAETMDSTGTGAVESGSGGSCDR